MLTNKEYSQLITSLFYASNGDTVPLTAVNSLLRMSTDNPGNMIINREEKSLTITDSPKPTSFFSRLVYFFSLGQK